MTEEVIRRRERSFQILRSEGIPYIEHLPVIEDSTTIVLRSPSDIVNRVIALTIVAFKASGNDHDQALSLVQEWDALSLLTPDESVFVDDPETSQGERIEFSWRWESVNVLLWALGMRDRLRRPDVETDVPRLFAIVENHRSEGLLRAARLRSTREILDQADIIYRYHWAVREALLNRENIPGSLNHGVVAERHHALNWLISYLDAEWDEVETNT